MYTESVIVHLAECLAERRTQRHDAGRRPASLWTLLTRLASLAIDASPRHRIGAGELGSAAKAVYPDRP
jgi:hypothetical protein